MTDSEVDAFIAKVTPAKRRSDAETLLALMRRVTGTEPELSGTIVGFGSYHYKYDSGRTTSQGWARTAPAWPASTSRTSSRSTSTCSSGS